MVKNFFLKFISNSLIIISSIISVLVITIITICIYIIINKSIIINDNNKLITKVISWYYQTSVSFEYIKIGNLQNKKNITIEVNKLIINNYENYKKIQLDNLTYNIYFSGLNKSKYYIANIELFNPRVIYENNDNYKNNNTIAQRINNLLINVKGIKIINGKFFYKTLEEKYYLSNINIKKGDIGQIDIIGDFLYKDNNFYKEYKKFSFKSEKVLNNYKINLNFTKLALPNFILNILDINNSYYISGLFSGEAVLNINNNKIVNTELNIYSKDSIINLKENLDFNNFSIINIPDLNKVSLSLFYDFNKSIFKINNLTFDIKNNLKNDSKIVLSAEKSLNNQLYNINYNFKNIYVKDFIKVHEYRANLFLENLFTGSGNVTLLNKNIDSINLVINNFSYEEVIFQDIGITFNKANDIGSIIFTLDGGILSFFKIFNKYNINSYNFKNFKKNQYRDSSNRLNFKVKIPNISKNFDNYIIDIKGNLSFEVDDLYYINNYLYIKNINYLIYIDKDKIDLSGLAIVNDVDINFNLIKLDESIINFNFYLHDQFFINNNLNKKIKGITSMACRINSQINIWLYSCDSNLTKNIITIPSLGFIKSLDEPAYLNFNGIINNRFLLEEDNNFSYKHLDNLFTGSYYFDGINNSYDINFNKFIYNKNNLVLDLSIKNNSFDINIASGVLDLTPFLVVKNSIKNNINTIDIKLNANLNKVIIFDDVEFGPTNISSKNIYNGLTIESIYNTIDTINFNVKTNKNNILSYYFKASNAGKFFNLLNYNTEIKGGILSSEGFIGLLDNDNDMMGTLSIDDFKIMKTPLFAELLLAASFTGLFDLLNNEGIAFDQFDAQYTKKNNLFNIIKARAYGFSLGLTGQGVISTLDKTLNLNGSIVPAYKLNTIFNNIPLIGEILSGKEDEGIFAINYNAKGSWKNPVFVVNPLSILTPGIIRNIFD